MDSTQSWLAVLGLAVGTFLIRYSFIGLFAKRDMPHWLHHALGLMVPAIFTAIVCSGVALVAVQVVGQVGGHTSMQLAGLAYWPRYAAALVALAVALRTQGNLLATVVAGMCITCTRAAR